MLIKAFFLTLENNMSLRESGYENTTRNMTINNLDSEMSSVPE